MELVALCVSICAVIGALVAIGFALAARGDVAHIQAQLTHGITREDIDKLHHRVNVLVEKMGGLQASVTAQGNQMSRIDSYLRRTDS
jgi:hypothetical protein